MTIYLDSGVAVSMFVKDDFGARADAFLQRTRVPMVLADFAAAEFISAIARLRRTGYLTLPAARQAIANFDRWRPGNTLAAETQPVDVRVADAFLRRLDLVLRTPDAIHLAIVQRLGAELATFDEGMADCARALGISVLAI